MNLSQVSGRNRDKEGPAMKKDILERLRARRTSRHAVSIDENLKHDVDDAILEIARLRKALANANQ